MESTFGSRARPWTVFLVNCREGSVSRQGLSGEAGAARGLSLGSGSKRPQAPFLPRPTFWPRDHAQISSPQLILLEMGTVRVPAPRVL